MEVLSKKKLKFKIDLDEFFKITDNDFEQNYYSRTSRKTYRVGFDSIKLMKRMAYYDKYYENITNLVLKA